MNQQQALAAIRAFGLTASYSPDYREYRVAFPLLQLRKALNSSFETAKVEQEKRAYYTDCAADAVDTACRMAAMAPAYCARNA